MKVLSSKIEVRTGYQGLEGGDEPCIGEGKTPCSISTLVVSPPIVFHEEKGQEIGPRCLCDGGTNECGGRTR